MTEEELLVLQQQMQRLVDLEKQSETSFDRDFRKMVRDKDGKPEVENHATNFIGWKHRRRLEPDGLSKHKERRHQAIMLASKRTLICAGCDNQIVGFSEWVIRQLPSKNWMMCCRKCNLKLKNDQTQFTPEQLKAIINMGARAAVTLKPEKPKRRDIPKDATSEEKRTLRAESRRKAKQKYAEKLRLKKAEEKLLQSHPRRAREAGILPEELRTDISQEHLNQIIEGWINANASE